MRLRLAVTTLAAASLATAALADSGLDALRTIAVQDGGRMKPLDTFARETARRISGARPFTGGESVAGLDPVEWILSMMADPARWQDQAVVRVAHAGLRDAIALPHGKDRYTFRELVAHRPFLEAAERVHEKLRRDERLDPVEQEIATLYDNLSVVAGLFSGESLRIVPTPDPKGAWASLAELAKETSPRAEQARELTSGLLTAYAAGGRDNVGVTAAALARSLRAMAPAAYPAETDLAREVHYNRLKPFRWAWVLYLFGSLALLSSLPLASRALSVGGFALVIGGLTLNTYGLYLRTVVSGRAPVTNMYETVVFAAWGAVVIALGFEAAHRVRYLAACAGGLAVVALILADNVPIIDGSIAPLVPVLRDNMWLTVHVLTITLGYAAFLLAMGIGHLNLGLYFFAPRKAALLRSLSLFLYRSLQIGTFFLAVGTLLGGVWASYSWGRFWGWDPKETWALIALLGYLVVLHGRFVGWFREFGLAVGSIVGFLLVLMAWYGVNFILGTGLHSYGFGSGGYAYVGGFVAFEALVIVGAFVRLRALRPPSPAVAPARLAGSTPPLG